jgi:hypothetical protein
MPVLAIGTFTDPSKIDPYAEAETAPYAEGRVRS